jgi:hypothetical protein
MTQAANSELLTSSLWLHLNVILGKAADVEKQNTNNNQTKPKESNVF